MDVFLVLALMVGCYPLLRAWRANRHSPLAHALAWAAAGWLACTCAVVGPAWAVYLALCLVGCAGIAVLGARRPGAAAWNFVVLGLLAVLLRPLLEGLGELRLGGAHLAFLGGCLAVGLGNYLPTRLGPAALTCAAGCGVILARLAGVELGAGGNFAGWLALALTPWVAWAGIRHGARGAFDGVWLGYRDRFGFVWGQRTRDQFNRAAANAHLGVFLRWGGLTAEDSPEDEAKALALLRATLKRFDQPTASGQ
jgi:hypothetical protein